MNDRAALTGILFMLKTGVPWEMLPQEMGYGSGMTCSASIVASMQGEVGRGEVLAREAVELAEQSGDRAGRVWALLMLSFAERCRGDHQAAASHAEAAVEEAWTLDDDDLPPFLRAFAFNRLGHEAYELGNWSRAEAVLQEALERWRRLGSPWGIGESCLGSGRT